MRTRRSAALVVVLGAVLAVPSSAQATTCAAYPNQAAAQRAADTRDADGDGIYCEALPCPCLKPGTGSPAPSPGPTSSAPVHRAPTVLPATFRGRCVHGPRPDRRSWCSPGATFRFATAARVCTPGYSTAVRFVTYLTRRAVFYLYGLRQWAPYSYENDHLISLELGGSNSPRNLWPQSEHSYGIYSALNKDRVENRLHAEVCNGSISLATAQARIKYWYYHLNG